MTCANTMLPLLLERFQLTRGKNLLQTYWKIIFTQISKSHFSKLRGLEFLQLNFPIKSQIRMQNFGGRHKVFMIKSSRLTQKHLCDLDKIVWFILHLFNNVIMNVYVRVFSSFCANNAFVFLSFLASSNWQICLDSHGILKCIKIYGMKEENMLMLDVW